MNTPLLSKETFGTMNTTLGITKVDVLKKKSVPFGILLNINNDQHTGKVLILPETDNKFTVHITTGLGKILKTFKNVVESTITNTIQTICLD